MTAFARQQTQGPWGTIVWELRSVNHRYLELSFRLPESMRLIETQLRSILQTHLSRGKVDVYLRYQPFAQQSLHVVLNEPLVKALLDAHRQVTTLAKVSDTALDVMRLLAWPMALQIEDAFSEDIQKAVVATFTEAVNELVDARNREGAALKPLLKQRFVQVRDQIDVVQKQLPMVLQQQKERLLHRLDDVKAALDPQRFEQEMVLFAQKIDVAEEIDRAKTHLKEALRIIEQPDAMGRRLDFLLQELNREANTIGSKSVHADVTKAVVEIKVLLEQIREQVQNIE